MHSETQFSVSLSKPPVLHRPQRIDAARNRSRILTAAHKQLTEHGLGVSMEQIAAASGVAVGTLYKHFASKAELVHAVFDAVYASSLAGVADVAEDCLQRSEQGASAMEELTGILVQLMDAAVRCHAVKAAARALNVNHLVSEEIEGRTSRALRQLIHTAQVQGDLRPDFRVEDVQLLFRTFPTDLPGAARARWMTLLLTGLTVR